MNTRITCSDGSCSQLMSKEPQQTKEDQLQTPEPERPDNRMKAQTELKAAVIAN